MSCIKYAREEMKGGLNNDRGKTQGHKMLHVEGDRKSNDLGIKVTEEITRDMLRVEIM